MYHRSHSFSGNECLIKMSSAPVVTKHLPNFVQFLVAVCFPRKSPANILRRRATVTGAMCYAGPMLTDHSSWCVDPLCAVDTHGVWIPWVHWTLVSHLTLGGRVPERVHTIPGHPSLIITRDIWAVRRRKTGVSEVSCRESDGRLLLIQLHRVRRQEHRGGPHPLHHGHDDDQQGEDGQSAQAD